MSGAESGSAPGDASDDTKLSGRLAGCDELHEKNDHDHPDTDEMETARNCLRQQPCRLSGFTVFLMQRREIFLRNFSCFQHTVCLKGERTCGAEGRTPVASTAVPSSPAAVPVAVPAPPPSAISLPAVGKTTVWSELVRQHKHLFSFPALRVCCAHLTLPTRFDDHKEKFKILSLSTNFTCRSFNHSTMNEPCSHNIQCPI